MLQRLSNWVAGLLPNRGSGASLSPYSGSGSLPVHADDPAMLLGNPLRAMSPVMAVSIMEQAMRGEWTRSQWLMYWIEQIDADVLTLVDRRSSGLRQLDWAIRTDADADERGLKSLADEQKQALEDRYMAISNMRQAVETLCGAKFRGYAHLAIGDDGDADTATRLEPLDQWWWVRDGMYGGWYWNPEAKTGNFRALGSPIDPATFIIREEPRCLIWIAILKYLRATYSAKWWDQFLEIASRRGTVIIAPEGLPAEARPDFEMHAANIARGNNGWLPAGSEVKLTGPDAQGGSLTVWESRLRYLKEDLILAGTGGLLTALAQSTGIGGSQGQEQGDVWRSLLRADAQDISEVFQEQFDKRVLAKRFPGKPILAWFELDTNEKPTANSILTDVKLAFDAGFEADEAEISEKTGLTLTKKAPPPEPTLPSGGAMDADQMMNRRSVRLANRSATGAEPLSASIAAELGVPETWLAPVSDWLATLEARAADSSVSDADLAAFLAEAVKQVPELFGQMDAQALADMLERAMGAAALQGAKESMRKGSVPLSAPLPMAIRSRAAAGAGANRP